VGRAASIDGASYVYDPFDRIVEASATLQILYSPIGKLAIQNKQTNTRTYLGLPNGSWVVYSGGGISYYFHHADLLGSAERIFLGPGNIPG
jgi:hypothetical protein